MEGVYASDGEGSMHHVEGSMRSTAWPTLRSHACLALRFQQFVEHFHLDIPYR